jgi:hypothetical protein
MIAGYLLWCATNATIQLGILFLYKRLFFVVNWFCRVCYVIMALVSLWCIFGWATNLGLCRPIRKLWEPMVSALLPLRKPTIATDSNKIKTPGKCGNGKTLCTSIGLIHAILDFTILMMPLPLVWKLNTSVIKKFLISVLLLCGVL